MINFDEWFEYKCLDFEKEMVFVYKILVKEEERDFLVGVFLNLKAKISCWTKTDMTVGLKLKVAPLDEFFPKEKKSRFIEFGE